MEKVEILVMKFESPFACVEQNFTAQPPSLGRKLASCNNEKIITAPQIM